MSIQIEEALQCLSGQSVRAVEPSYPQVVHLMWGPDVAYGRRTMPRWLLDPEASGLRVEVDDEVLMDTAPDTRIDEDVFDLGCTRIQEALLGRAVEQVTHEADGSLVITLPGAQITITAFADPDLDDPIDDWALTDVQAMTELAGLPGGGAELRDARAPIDAPIVLAARPAVAI